MKEPETRTDVLATLFVEQAVWDALLDEVGEARMEEPGVEGRWSVKDIMAHLTGWDEWIAEQVRAAGRGEPYAPEEIGMGETDEVNEQLVARWRGFSAGEARAESRRVFGELVTAVEQLADDDLAERGRFPWAPEQTLAEGITTEFTEHYREHAEKIREWLEE